MSKAVRAVTRAVQKLYPKELADSSWDNTGLLVDCSDSNSASIPSVLLTVDLTEEVASEAIENQNNVIVAYHPFIFRGIKAISSSNPQHRSLLRLIQHSISVYSPHTAVDAASGGVNDWLIDICGETVDTRVVEPTSSGADTGMGRKAELERPVSFDDLVKNVKAGLGLDTVQVVRAARQIDEPIKTVAVCAGSGASVLSGVQADVFVTGEMGHHEMLYLRESGTSSIVCGHSNTERGYLTVMKKLLEKELPEGSVSIAQSDRDPIEYA